MTTERKIEVLEKSKVTLSKNYTNECICSAFFQNLSEHEKIQARMFEQSSVIVYLKDIFLKHRPANISDNGIPWWRKDENGLKIRLSVIDKMIDEIQHPIIIIEYIH